MARPKKPKESVLHLQYVFYAIGIVFLFATIVYFSYEYVFELTRMAKTLVLCMLIIIAYTLAHLLQERDL